MPNTCAESVEDFPHCSLTLFNNCLENNIIPRANICINLYIHTTQNYVPCQMTLQLKWYFFQKNWKVCSVSDNGKFSNIKARNPYTISIYWYMNLPLSNFINICFPFTFIQYLVKTYLTYFSMRIKRRYNFSCPW